MGGSFVELLEGRGGAMKQKIVTLEIRAVLLHCGHLKNNNTAVARNLRTFGNLRQFVRLSWIIGSIVHLGRRA